MYNRLIIDTNIFSSDRFDRFIENFNSLASNKSVSIYITPMLIDETMRLLLKEGPLKELKKYSTFFINISKQRWLKDNFEIFKSELGIFPLKKDYHFMDKVFERQVRDNINSIIQGGILIPNDKAYLNKLLQSNYQHANEMRKIGKEIRKEVSKKLKGIAIKQGNISKKYTWEIFKKKCLCKFGKDLISKKRFHKIWSPYIALFQWMINRKRCCYFTEWVTGLLYMQYYAMCYPNEPIDRNAQADIQHLMYLKFADGIISEDQKFMKKAWEDLYKPLGKKYYSIEDLKNIK